MVSRLFSSNQRVGIPYDGSTLKDSYLEAVGIPPDTPAWYFATRSSASVVYGSLTTAVIALFSREIVATLLLLGAQVISEYEQLDQTPGKKPA